MKKLFAGIIAALALAGGSARAQVAQPTQGYLQVQGLAVTPFIIEADVEAGSPQSHAITLTNTTNQPLPIDVSINDFVPDAAGQPKFLSIDETANPAYELSSWITITRQPDLVIQPNQQTELIFSITPPQDAVPGTHYGGLLFSSRVPSKNDGSTEVTEKVGVIVLAKFGHGTEQGSITSFMAESASGGYQFLTSFYNSGNVHLRPKGEIYITDIFGHQVATVPVNRDAQIILPENHRIFESLWQPGWRFGRYKATAIIYYGNPKIEARVSTVIWIVPIKGFAVLLAGLLLLGYLLRLLIKKYNRYIISRSKGPGQNIKPPSNS